MTAHVRIRFVKRHVWKDAAGFMVFHAPGGALGETPASLTGSPVPLWQPGWEQAGFGHGRFGTGSFGWGQGGQTGGGFGYGRFGTGEFGYYNPEAGWSCARAFRDGLHTFGVRLVGRTGPPSDLAAAQSVLIRSVPHSPAGLTLTRMTAGQATLRWLPSPDVEE